MFFKKLINRSSKKTRESPRFILFCSLFIALFKNNIWILCNGFVMYEASTSNTIDMQFIVLIFLRYAYYCSKIYSIGGIHVKMKWYLWHPWKRRNVIHLEKIFSDYGNNCISLSPKARCVMKVNQKCTMECTINDDKKIFAWILFLEFEIPNLFP